MGENNLVNKIKDSAKSKVTQFLIPALLASGCSFHTTIYTDNLEKRTHVHYVNAPQRFFINNSYWNFYNFDPRMNRVHFRRYHRGNYINFYLNINDLQGHGIYFNYQSNTPYYNNHNQFNKSQGFSNQKYSPQRKISPRIRNNTRRR